MSKPALYLRLTDRTSMVRVEMTVAELESITRAAQRAGSRNAPWTLGVLDAARGRAGYQEAADAVGLPLAAWIRTHALAAAGHHVPALERQMRRVR